MLPSNMDLKIKTGTVIKFSYLMVTLVWGKTKMLTTPPRSGAQGSAIKNHKTKVCFKSFVT